MTCSADLLGCDETLSGTSVFGAEAATPVQLDRYNNFHATLKMDNVETAIATQLDLEIDFGLDDSGYAIGSGGYRTRINEGLITPSGTLTAFFDDKTFVEKAINSTKTSLQIKLTKGKTSLTIDLPEVLFARQTPGIEGAKGISQQLNFNAFYSDNADNTCVKFTLVNQTTSYAFGA